MTEANIPKEVVALFNHPTKTGNTYWQTTGKKCPLEGVKGIEITIQRGGYGSLNLQGTCDTCGIIMEYQGVKTG